MLRSRWLIFALGTTAFTISMFYRASSAIIAPDLTRDLGLGYGQLGFLGAVFFYTFALVQLPMGLILDRFGPRTTLFGLNLIGSAGALMFAWSSGPADAVTARALLGLGMASNLIGPLTLLAWWFPARRFATIQGLFMAVGATGGMLASSPLALLVEALGWRGSFQLLAGINLVLALLFLLLIRNRPLDRSPNPAPPPQAQSAKVVLKTLLGSKDFWLISWAGFLRYGAFAAIQSLWAGPYLMDHLGLSPILAGQLLLILNLAFILGAPTMGWLADSLLRSRKKSVILGMALMTLSILALGLWKEGLTVFGLGVIFFFMGFGNSSGNVMYPHIKNLMPPEMVGTALSGVNFFTMAGAGVFVHGMGGVLAKLAGQGPPGQAYRTAFLLCAGAMFAVVFLYLWTRDDRN